MHGFPLMLSAIQPTHIYMCLGLCACPRCPFGGLCRFEAAGTLLGARSEATWAVQRWNVHTPDAEGMFLVAGSGAGAPHL